LEVLEISVVVSDKEGLILRVIVLSSEISGVIVKRTPANTD